MKRKTNRKLWKKITIGSLVTVVSAATVFGVSLSFIKNKKHSSHSKINIGQRFDAITSSPKTPNPNKPVKYSARNASDSPSILYVLDVAGNSQYDDYTQVEEDIIPITTGLKNLGMFDDIVAPFSDNLLKIIPNTIPSLTGTYKKGINQAISFFNDVSSINEQFKAINSFQDTSNDELNIYLPNNIYNVNQVGQPKPNKADWDLSGRKNEVQYKIAEIDLNKLNNQEKVLEFVLKDKSSPDANKHDFHLVMNNKENGLAKLFIKGENAAASATVTDDINVALNKGKIILRDTKETYRNPSSKLKKSFDKISLFYNKLSKKIEVIAKPDKNNNKDKPLTFKAFDQETQQMSKIGFLDVNFSPFYRKENFTNSSNSSNNSKNIVRMWPTVKTTSGAPKDYEKASPYLKIHRIRGAQEEIPSKKGIFKSTFWLAENEKIKINITYKPEPLALTVGNNITYKYDGTKFEVSPSIITLNTKSKKPPKNANVSYEYEKATIADVKYLKVTITSSLQIQINTGGDIVIPGSGEKRIFFEDPSNELAPNINTTPGKNGETQISNPTKFSANKRKYIESVLSSWYPNLGNKPSPEWLLPSQSEDKDNGSSRVYDFNYDYYYENKNGGVIRSDGTKDSLSNNKHKKEIFVHDLKTFRPEKDSKISSAYKKIKATGQNVGMLLGNYFNALVDWLENKFGEVNILKGKDFYKPTDIPALSKMVTKLKNNAPRQDVKLNKILDALIILATKGYNSIPNQDKILIDNLDDHNSKDYWNLGSNRSVKTIIDGNLELISSPKDPDVKDVDWSKPKAVKANNLIIAIIEREVVRSISEIIENENKTFTGVYSSLLGKAMSFYLEGENGEYDSISKNALQIIDKSKLSNNFKNAKLIAIYGNPKSQVQSGKEQLKSLLDFIKNFGLEEKYLDATKADQFKTHYESGDILKKQKYVVDTNRASNRAAIGEMIGVVDEIVKKIVDNDKDIQPLSLIMKKIQQASITDKEGANEIKEAINKVIKKITSLKEGYKYKILSREYRTSYINNIAMGKNLSVILDKWVEKNKNKIQKKEIEQLKQTGLYDPRSLSDLAISLGYYNFDYFISSLTEAPKVPKTADEMLNSDFAKNVVFKIPKSNSIIDAISNPAAFLKYGIIGAGLMLSLVGISSFAISMTKSSKQSIISKKSNIIMKIIFAGISAIGVALAGLGVLVV